MQNDGHSSINDIAMGAWVPVIRHSHLTVVLYIIIGITSSMNFGSCAVVEKKIYQNISL